MDKKTGCSLGCFVSGYGKANWLDNVIMVAKNFTWVKDTFTHKKSFKTAYSRAFTLDVVFGCKELHMHMAEQENWVLTRKFNN